MQMTLGAVDQLKLRSTIINGEIVALGARGIRHGRFASRTALVDELFLFEHQSGLQVRNLLAITIGPSSMTVWRVIELEYAES